jgi:hypothetical protein
MALTMYKPISDLAELRDRISAYLLSMDSAARAAADATSRRQAALGFQRQAAAEMRDVMSALRTIVGEGCIDSLQTLAAVNKSAMPIQELNRDELDDLAMGMNYADEDGIDLDAAELVSKAAMQSHVQQSP